MLDKEIYDNIINDLNINIKLNLLKEDFNSSLSEKNFSSANCFRRLPLFGGAEELTSDRYFRISKVYRHFSIIIHEVIQEITNNHAYNFSNNEGFKSSKINFIEKINEIIIKPKINYLKSEKDIITKQENKSNSIATINAIKQLDVQALNNSNDIEKHLNSILLTFRNLVINYALDTRNEREDWVEKELEAIKDSLDCTIKLLVANLLIISQEFNLRTEKTSTSGAPGATTEDSSRGGEQGNIAKVELAFVEEQDQERDSLINGDGRIKSSNSILRWSKDTTLPSHGDAENHIAENLKDDDVASVASVSGVMKSASICSQNTFNTDISKSSKTVGAIQLEEIKEKISKSEKITEFSEKTADLLIEMMKSVDPEAKIKAQDLIKEIVENVDARCSNGDGFRKLCKKVPYASTINLQKSLIKSKFRLKN